MTGKLTLLLSYGNSQVMITGGVRPSTDDRREVDLYIHTDHVERLRDEPKDRVELRLGLEDTFYGTREFVIRDPNRFWLTFGQDVTGWNFGHTETLESRRFRDALP